MLALHLLLMPLLALPAAAQQILQFGDGQLPACAQNCAVLAQAQAVCVPVPATVKSCFCRSAYLTQTSGDLFKDPNAVCTQDCPNQQDRLQIQNWYKGYCAGENPEAGAAQPTQAQPTSTAGAPATSPTPVAAGSSNRPTSDNDAPKSWWSVHGRWIAMVIVLVIVFAVIIIVGVWWKRRHDRKVNRATDTPLPDGWGPPSNPHTYPATAPVTEKKPSGRTSTIVRPDNAVSEAEMGKSRRLKKLIGR